MIKFNHTSDQQSFVNVSSQTDQDAGPEPARIRDSRVIFDLTKALKSADKALIVWTLRGWTAHNQARRRGHREGHYWTFSSLDKWQAKHFPWLSVKQLGSLMTQLVKQGVVIRTRPSVHQPYWYRVDESALKTVCASLPSVFFLSSQTAGLSDESADLSDKTAGQSDKTSEHKTTIRKQENIKQGESNTQTTTAVQPPADTEHDAIPGSPDVVVQPPRPTEKEAETGEYSIKAEAPQNNDDGAEDQSLVEAPMSQHANDTSLSKVPLKVLSPVAADALRADLIRFGVVPGRITRLIQTYPEADIRHIMAYTKTPKGENIVNPAGFLIGELEHGGSGVLALRDQQMIKCDHETHPSPTRFTAPDGAAFTDEEREEIALIGFDRFIALRQMKESLHEHSNHSLDLEHEFA